MTIGIYKLVAKDIMTTDIVTVHPQERVSDALRLMTENRVPVLPVVDRDDRCVGVISQSDLVQLTRDADDDRDANSDTPFGLMPGRGDWDSVMDERLDGVMSDEVVTVSSGDLIVPVIVDRLIAQRIHHVPVVDDDGRLLGIVSTVDILRALRSTVPQET